MLAIFPGVSRSGATILGGELLGVDRAAAAHFTFYLAVPTMMGATVLDIYKNRDALAAAAWADIGIAFVVAFLVALVVVKGFIGYAQPLAVSQPFGWYRITRAGTGAFRSAWISAHKPTRRAGRPHTGPWRDTATDRPALPLPPRSA